VILPLRAKREPNASAPQVALLIALAVLSGIAGVGLAADDPGRAAAQQGSGRPNIILIVTDDQTDAQLRPDVMPNVMELAGQGATFTNAIVTTPLCCPSRASMLTGQYAHNHRALSNSYGGLAEKRNTLPVWLDRAGYRTIHIGKYLNNYEAFADPITQPAPGWDKWYSALAPRRYWDYDLQANGRTKHFGIGDDDYVTRVLNRKAASLVRRYGKRHKPFYMQLDEIAPHTGGPSKTARCTGRSPQPDPGDPDLFAAEPLPASPSLNEDDVSDKPPFIRDRRKLSDDDLGKITRRWGCALASLKAVDDGVADLYRTLEQAGELDNTVIIFTSDNGSYYGEHRIPDEKHFPYMEGIDVPLIIRAPSGTLNGNVPSETGLPVANIDIAPTILDLAKARPCRSGNDCRVMDGRSLVPLLKGKENKWPRDRALVLELRMDHADNSQGRTCRYRGILASAAAYVKHTDVAPVGTRNCQKANEIEYYDLDSDRFQLQNLHGARSGSAGQEHQLARRLRRLQSCSGVQARDPRRKGRAHCQ
jgi:N-acetylglucosamine-6-sulfatase